MKEQLLFFILLMVLGFSNNTDAQSVKASGTDAKDSVTTVYIVRHAEKITGNPDDRDPLLSAEGYQRAEDLRQYLKDEKIDMLFASPYQRTKLTLEPLSQERSKAIEEYSTREQQVLAEKISKYYKGKVVLIAGHSNSILELIEYFGAERPVAEISEDTYDYIFKLNIAPGKKVEVQTKRYGGSTNPTKR